MQYHIESNSRAHSLHCRYHNKYKNARTCVIIRLQSVLSAFSVCNVNIHRVAGFFGIRLMYDVVVFLFLSQNFPLSPSRGLFCCCVLLIYIVVYRFRHIFFFSIFYRFIICGKKVFSIDDTTRHGFCFQTNISQQTEDE